MLEGSILDALLYIHIFLRALLLSLLCSLLAHSGERRDTCSQGEAAASEQLLTLMLLLKSSCKSPGKAAGLMDRGRRTLAAFLLVAFTTARVCPSWAEALCPLQEGVSAPLLSWGLWQCWSSALRCWTIVLPGEYQSPQASTALSLSALSLGVW